MVGQNREFLRVWTLRLSLVTMIIVVILSWINAVKLFDMLVRAGVSFGLMYLLLTGSLILFDKTGIPPIPEEQSDTAPERGGLVDFSVGEDEIQVSQGADSAFPGQVDPNLSEGVLDGQQQAEIVRRMGWS